MTSVLPPPGPPPPASPPPRLGLEAVLPGVVFPDIDRGEPMRVRIRELLLVVVIGMAGNIVIRTSAATVAALVTLALLAALIIAGRRVKQPVSYGLIALSLALMPWLFGRASPALTTLTFSMIVLLLTLAASLSRGGRFFDLRASEIGGHQAAMLAEWVFALPMVRRLVAIGTFDKPVAAGVRGVLMAAPVVVVFALLLASADTVFANVLAFDNRLGPTASHAALSLVVAVVALGVVSRTAHKTPGIDALRTGRLGSVEVSVVLSAVLLLFGAFVTTKIITASGGAQHIIETAGLTRAQYARQGFFQLLWVAALTLMLIGALRFLHERADPTTSPSFRNLSLGVLALTLSITGISIQRLVLYIDALGLTPKRFWSLIAASLIGVVIVGYGVSIAGFKRGRSWFPGFVILAATVAVLGLNVVNPDGIIAKYNLTNPPEERAVDIARLARLSDDAVPAALEFRGNLPPEQRASFQSMLCRRFDLRQEFGPLGSNRSRLRADRLLDDFCPDPRPIARANRSD